MPITGTTYMLTRRCTQRQFLLNPSKLTNRIVLYVLGWAAEKHRISLHCFDYLANHEHLQFTDPYVAISDFARDLHMYIAKARNASLGRWENLWNNSRPSYVRLAGWVEQTPWAKGQVPRWLGLVPPRVLGPVVARYEGTLWQWDLARRLVINAAAAADRPLLALWADLLPDKVGGRFFRESVRLVINQISGDAGVDRMIKHAFGERPEWCAWATNALRARRTKQEKERQRRIDAQKAACEEARAFLHQHRGDSPLVGLTVDLRRLYARHWKLVESEFSHKWSYEMRRRRGQFELTLSHGSDIGEWDFIRNEDPIHVTIDWHTPLLPSSTDCLLVVGEVLAAASDRPR